MKPEFRQRLAQQPFEEKIRKVSELIQLSRDVKHQQLRGSLKGSKAIDVFVSERERERSSNRKNLARRFSPKHEVVVASLCRGVPV